MSEGGVNGTSGGYDRAVVNWIALNESVRRELTGDIGVFTQAGVTGMTGNLYESE
jgi:hypothetical protein